MVFEIDCNGVDTGKGTHLSASTFPMMGKKDNLKWPLQLVNWAGDHLHVMHIFDFDKVANKRGEGGTFWDHALYGPDILKFIDHLTVSKIISSPSSHSVKYVADDKILFRVVSVVFPSD